MFNRWYYSLLMLGIYLVTFAAWKVAPSRIAFLFIGMVAIAALSCGMSRARRNGYFADRLDLVLHAWVIVDLFIETVAFEAFRVLQPFAVMQKFHDNLNFIGCAVALSTLVGGYRWFALRQTGEFGDLAKAS